MTILAHNEHHAAQMLSEIESWPVEIKVYEDQRRLIQNGRRWARMTWLQNNVQPPLSKESWHYKLMIETGYVKNTVMTQFGTMKIEIPIPMESKKLGIKRFAEMEEKTDAYLATEYGIEIPDNDE